MNFQDSVLQQAIGHQMDMSDLNDAQKQEVKVSLNQLEKMTAGHVEAAGHIASDDGSTGIGKDRKLAELRQSSVAALHQIMDSSINTLAKRIGEVEIQLEPQHPETDATLQYLKESEIRGLVKDMDQLEIIVLYQELAVTGKDDDTMRSIENAPQAFPLIHDVTILDAGRRGRAARHSPEAALQLKQLRQWKGMLQSAVSQAETVIGIEDDFLTRIAKGELVPD